MYLDTANLTEIEAGMKCGVFHGVTTNPTILLKEGKPRKEQALEILKLDVPFLYIQVIGRTLVERFEDCKIILDFGERVGVKIPMDALGLELVTKVKKEFPTRKILGTAIYSADQGILGAFAGCDCLAPYVNRMSNNDIDPFQSIATMRKIIEDRQLPTKILAASFKNSSQVTQALACGSHTATIPYDIFDQMINKSLGRDAIEVFNQDGAALEEA